DGLNKYLSKAHSPVKNLDEIIKYNKEHAPKAMPYFKQELLEESASKGDLQSTVYVESLSKILEVTKTAIDDCMKQYQLDAILSPGDGPSWCTDLVNGDAFFGNSYYWPAAICGYPHITVPMGFTHGLPVGLCFIGEKWSEGTLIGFAYAYEQVSKSRRAPKFLNKIG
ncbi:MAG: amidase family protein, partial [Chitinophagaceae bacterium]